MVLVPRPRNRTKHGGSSALRRIPRGLSIIKMAPLQSHIPSIASSRSRHAGGGKSRSHSNGGFVMTRNSFAARVLTVFACVLAPFVMSSCDDDGAGPGRTARRNPVGKSWVRRAPDGSPRYGVARHRSQTVIGVGSSGHDRKDDRRRDDLDHRTGTSMVRVRRRLLRGRRAWVGGR